jgi:hypothetical protein
VTRTLFPPHSERSGNAFWPPAFGTFPERPERGPPGDLEARARSRRGTVCTSQMNNNKLISAASSYNIERSLIAPLDSRREGGSVSRHKKDEPDDDRASEHQGCPPRTKGFESGDTTRKMAETSHGASVRNVPGTRSEARRSERSVTLVTLVRMRMTSISLVRPRRPHCWPTNGAFWSSIASGDAVMRSTG